MLVVIASKVTVMEASAHVSKNVPQANAATHSGEDEGGARRPLVTTIFSLLGFRAEYSLEKILDSHLVGREC